ncbi:MAG: hypothetical protein AAFP79_05115 [Pseudomonadota bacterium]
MRNPHAAFAGGELARRRAALAQALVDRRINDRDARANFACWLAIACAAGAPGPEFEVVCLYPEGAKGRAFPEDFAPADHWRAELERARNAASGVAVREPTNFAAIKKAVALNQLARHLGCKPITVTVPHARAA